MFVRILLTQRRSFVPVSMWRRRTLRGNVNVKFEDKTAARLKGRFIKHGERKRRADLAEKKKKRCEARKTEEEKQDDTSGQTYTYSSFWNKHTKV